MPYACRRTRRRSACWPLCLPLLATALPGPAAAQTLARRLAVRGEGGVGSMLAVEQQLRQGYGMALQGSARVGLTLLEPLAVQATFSNWWFFSDRGDGQAVLLGGGLRLEPRVGQLGRVFVDGNAGLGITGADLRAMVDAGAGFEFAAAPWIGVGPVVRYGRVFAAPEDFPSDAEFWSVGLGVAVRIPEPPRPPTPPAPLEEPAAEPPRDTDGDGVMDPDDRCVREPAGEHPDPIRPGCPQRDTDGDTVFDADDECPTVPRGEHPDPERVGCPDGDEDGDGVFDHADQCRRQPAGARPDPLRPGCPIEDRDNDTVPDATDHCPDEPGAPHPDPSRNGCPGLVRIEGGAVRINRPVFFATNRDRILPRSFPVLQAVADALRATPQIRRVVVEGHTDSVGNDERNLQLSQRRADSVMAWLIQHGVEAGRLEAHGYGETQPIESNRTGAGRAANRRVEFRIVDPAPAARPAEPGGVP